MSKSLQRFLIAAFAVMFVFSLTTSSLLAGDSVNKFVEDGKDDPVVNEKIVVDDAFGYNSQVKLIDDINAKIDEALKNNNLNSVKALALKKKMADLTNFIKANKESSNVKLAFDTDKKAELASMYKEIESLFAVTKEAENRAQVEAMKPEVDRVFAGAGDFSSCQSLSNEALKSKLNELISNHKSYGYNGARQLLFTKIDNFGGKVKCVYTTREITCDGIPSANAPQAMNTEHTWPKSLGAGSEPAKSDLNHLYPTDSFANSTRSSYPFGNVNESSAKWKQGGSCFDGKVFMPREDHRGKVARAYFYFSTRYSMQIPDSQEKVLKEWHNKYPVTDAERERNEKVFQYQNNRNPFVDAPELANKIANF